MENLQYTKVAPSALDLVHPVQLWDTKTPQTLHILKTVDINPIKNTLQ